MDLFRNPPDMPVDNQESRVRREAQRRDFVLSASDARPDLYGLVSTGRTPKIITSGSLDEIETFLATVKRTYRPCPGSKSEVPRGEGKVECPHCGKYVCRQTPGDKVAVHKELKENNE